MRSIKELLIIVRDNLEPMMELDSTVGGMCRAISNLEDAELITSNEKSLLLNYLDNNITPHALLRKKKYPLYHDGPFVLSRHWWTPRHILPRLKWLNQQIQKQP